MPWFPDFINAVELVRRQTRAAGQADPVSQYFIALNKGDSRMLETVWPGKVVVYDPRAGEIQGHEQLQQFVRQNQSWLAERHARIETVASTVVGGRAVVELLAHLADGEEDLAWPVAVVAESPTIGRWSSAPTAASGRSTGGATSDPLCSTRGTPISLASWAAIWPHSMPVTPTP